jgi:dienelactone hydrolase
MARFLFVAAVGAVMAAIFASTSWAAVKTEMIPYKDGDVQLQGYLAYDDAQKGTRPAVLVVYEWWGLNDYVKKRARELAGLGYIAFAADIYGGGFATTDPAKAGELAGKFRSGDRKLLRERVNIAFQLLRDHKFTDKERMAAIGYCFGGTTALELARSGADIAGAVSIHGTLDTPNPADAKNIKAKVLVLQGADDPYVRLEQISAFEDEMRKGNVDWQMIIYGGAVHSFSNPNSGSDPSKGVAYNEKADKRSWKHMRLFFDEIFK